MQRVVKPARSPTLRPHAGTPMGLFIRLRVFELDYLIIAACLPVIIAFGVAGHLYFREFIATNFDTRWSGQLVAFALATVPMTLYFSVSEAGPAQATWGKRRTGLRVVTVSGERMTWPRSFGHTLLKFVPWELSHACIWYVSLVENAAPAVYGAGFALVWLLVGANAVGVATNKRHQALYDRVAGTMVMGERKVGDSSRRRRATGSASE